jgi:hypothetical protein
MRGGKKKKKKKKRFRSLADQAHTLQWEKSKPTTFNAPASTVIPRSQIRRQPHSSIQSPNKLVSLPRRSSLALSKTATPIVHSIPVARSYAARWIPQQHLVVAVNVPPSWHLGFPFFKLWTMAKLTYNLLRLL